MFYEEHLPHPGLRSNIRCYWTLAIPTCVPAQAEQHLLAEGMELSFNLADPVQLITMDPEPALARRSCICGPMTQPMRMRTDGRVEVFGVCFRPGGAYAFFPGPASELVNGHVEIDDLWGSRALEIVDRVQNGGSTVERVDFLDRHFLHKFDNSPRHDPCIAAALNFITARKGQVNIDHLARSAGVSSRELERRFKERVGISPKQLCRSLRFKNVFAQLAASQADCGVSTALACGYYDQSHMIRDFKHYTGASPAAFSRSHRPWQVSLPVTSRLCLLT